MIIKINKNRALLDASIYETVLLNNALLLIIDGPYAIDKSEFQTLTGSTKEEVEALLGHLGRTIDDLKSKYPNEYYGTPSNDKTTLD